MNNYLETRPIKLGVTFKKYSCKQCETVSQMFTTLDIIFLHLRFHSYTCNSVASIHEKLYIYMICTKLISFLFFLLLFYCCQFPSSWLVDSSLRKSLTMQHFVMWQLLSWMSWVCLFHKRWLDSHYWLNRQSYSRTCQQWSSHIWTSTFNLWCSYF